LFVDGLGLEVQRFLAIDKLWLLVKILADVDARHCDDEDEDEAIEGDFHKFNLIN
jgi:hypothetical protein